MTNRRIGRQLEPLNRWIQRQWQRRWVRFITVAGSCTFIQEVILLVLTRRYGVEKTAANGIGFAVAAQVNFTGSSLLTWGDRALDWTLRKTAVRWAQFNSVAVIALLVNEGVFAIVTHKFNIPIIAASLFGILIGALVTFKGNNGVTFRSRKTNAAVTCLATSEDMPTLEKVRAAVKDRTLVYFMPAYHEAMNLPHAVADVVVYLRELALREFRVIIVNDGSTDNTGDVANGLARRYPEVVVHHHQLNRGYGGALITGFNAAVLARTATGLPFDWWAFSDSDRQFKARSLGTLLLASQEGDTDLVVGQRLNRESQFRRWLGRAWHHYGSFAVGRDLLVVGDVDCGLKMGRVAALAMFAHKLFGQKAAISPELIARSSMAGHSIIERPVTYLPRTAGTSTGDNPKVMIVSGLHILLVGVALRIERYFGRTVRLARKHRGGITVYDGSSPSQELSTVPIAEVAKHREIAADRSRQTSRHDPVAWCIGILATLLSIAAYIVTVRIHAVLLYGDAVSHLEIARRIIDGTSPGLPQIGGVWPPLPHLLELPFVWDNRLYYNGFAGCIVSMVAFVATTILIYMVAYRLANRKIAGIAAATIFAFNASMLYMQSIPMTEALFFCFMVAAVYCTQQWMTTDSYQWLVAAGITGLLATLVRYEAWIIMGGLTVAVGIAALTRHKSKLTKKLNRARARDRILLFTAVGGIGIGIWMAWNWAIFGSPFAFQTGAYAKPSLWLSSNEPAIHHWFLSLKTYWLAVIYNVPWIIVVAAGLGLVALFIREFRSKERAIRTLPTLSMLLIFPFFVVAIYGGQRPLHLPPIEPDLYNVRFGLILLLPIAILGGYMIASIPEHTFGQVCGLALVAIAAISCVQTLRHSGPVTYEEALGSQNPIEKVVGNEFAQHYNGGLVLAQSFGDEGIVFFVPSNELVYEGSYRQWNPDRRSPSIHDIHWIIMRCGPSADLVCDTVNAGELKRYNLVWESSDKVYRIYEIRQSFLKTLAAGR